MIYGVGNIIQNLLIYQDIPTKYYNGRASHKEFNININIIQGFYFYQVIYLQFNEKTNSSISPGYMVYERSTFISLSNTSNTHLCVGKKRVDW